MKRKSKVKGLVITLVSLVLAGAIGFGCWFFLVDQNKTPVMVMPFHYIGMTEYWGDMQESYGPVSTDRIQTVYLSETQTVTEILVQPGDTVVKGDVLLRYDTTLSDLALERKRLEVEKKKLELEDARERLEEINRMVPMVIPEFDDDPEPVPPENLGLPLAGPYQIVSKEDFDGSLPEKSVICWLGSKTNVDTQLLSAMLDHALALQAANGTEPADPADPSSPTDPEATAPTEDSQPTDPTDETTQPPDETLPPPPTEESCYLILKITGGDLSMGYTALWQGLTVTRDLQTGNVGFRFFDASMIQDPTVEPEEEVEIPEIDFGSGYTASQIAQMRSEQEKLIKDLAFNVKMAEADYKIMQLEVSDGNIYAQIDGEVVSVLTPEEAKYNYQPIVKVSGGGGFYVTGSVSELSLDTLQPGQEVTVNDWNTGMAHTGTVESVNDYPVSGQDYYSGMGNPNVSFYAFTVFIDGSADLMEGSYVSIQYASADVSNGIYLENPYLREENGRSYVYLRGAEDLLEKRYVTTGKSLWGSYTEILSGLTEEDFVAFPYGKHVQAGAPTYEGDPSELYQ